MEIEIDYTKSAHENAGEYYNRGKKLALKIEGARKAALDLKKQLEIAEKKGMEQQARKTVRIVEREWYEKFHWMRTSDGMLAIGGRDAHQNEAINSKHFTERDLFFHADIFGASVFVLQDGMKATQEARNEAAHFAGCYSSAWKEGLRSIDVYAMRREQVSKSSQKGSLGTGSFLLKGEREWFRSIPLGIIMFVKDGTINAVPTITFDRLRTDCPYAEITQGDDKKSDAAKKISRGLQYEDIDRIMMELPAGSFHILIKNYKQAKPNEKENQ